MLRYFKTLLAGVLLNGLVEIERKRHRNMVKSQVPKEEYEPIQALVDCGILSLFDIKMGIRTVKEKVSVYQKAGFDSVMREHLTTCMLCQSWEANNKENPQCNRNNCVRWHRGQCPTPTEAMV